MIIYDDDGIGYKVVPMSVIEEIKAECVRAVDRIPITFSKQDADNCLKKDIRDIFDKHIGKEQE